MSRINYYEKVHTLFQELKKNHPSYGMGKHIATAFIEYTDIWGMTDKLFYTILKKYSDGLELDIPHKEDDIDLIINDGLHLSSMFEEEDEEV